MEFSRIFEVVRICLPVFGLIGLGKIIQMRGMAGPSEIKFINQIVYYFALPALIFGAVATQPFQSLLNKPLIVSTFVGVFLIGALAIAVVRFGGFKGGVGAIMIFGTFWANTSYMGFPIVESAFGKEGLAFAAIVNAFTMPLFILGGFLAITFFDKGQAAGKQRLGVTGAIMNPIVGAAIFGIVIAYVRDAAGIPARTDLFSRALCEVSSIIVAFCKLMGSMGLPLALISVGTSLTRQYGARHIAPIAFIALGKLILAPLFTLLMLHFFFPDTPRIVTAVGVLLMGMPNAVASYVICMRLGVEEKFMSACIITTTVLSMITIPVWMYFLL